MKKSGILLHISSLGSDFGIGDFGSGAFGFAEELSKSGQSLWQILPLDYIGTGNSPYQCYSAMALNPYFIDPVEFVTMGLIDERFLGQYRNTSCSQRVAYDEVFRIKDDIFEKAFYSFDTSEREYVKYKANNSHWLDDFAMFMVILKKTENRLLLEFPPGLLKRERGQLQKAGETFKREIEKEKFLQFMAERQWFRLKEHANRLGIEIIGDLPIYVSFDSVEVWTHREMFDIDSHFERRTVAGVPPDKLSDDGQVWMNPVYDWKYHMKTGYMWWIGRIRNALEKFDIVRLDHFRGFSRYYVVKEPFDDPGRGRWKKGPGYGMFRKINREFDINRIIAEDLGHITRDVRRLIKRTGYAGMKVAQFGYGGDLSDEHLPANYRSNYYAYTGTHDNNTLVGWYDEMSGKELAALHEIIPDADRNNICGKIIRQVMESDSKAAVVPMQDYLGLDGKARMNTPSTLGGNWEWRIETTDDELWTKIKKMSERDV